MNSKLFWKILEKLGSHKKQLEINDPNTINYLFILWNGMKPTKNRLHIILTRYDRFNFMRLILTPQGSLFGPLLFTIYTADIVHITRSNISMFAGGPPSY